MMLYLIIFRSFKIESTVFVYFPHRLQEKKRSGLLNYCHKVQQALDKHILVPFIPVWPSLFVNRIQS